MSLSVYKNRRETDVKVGKKYYRPKKKKKKKLESKRFTGRVKVKKRKEKERRMAWYSSYFTDPPIYSTSLGPAYKTISIGKVHGHGGSD